MQKILALIATTCVLSACNNNAQAPTANTAPEQTPVVQETITQPATEAQQAAQSQAPTQSGLPPHEIEQIEALLKPIHTFQGQIGLWDKLPTAERMQIIRSFAPAEKEMRNKWPQLNQCANALNAAGIWASDTNIATTTIAHGRDITAHKINAMTWMAFVAGEAFGACNAELNELAIP